MGEYDDLAEGPIDRTPFVSSRAEVERLREEYRRLAWCHLGVGGNGCASCRERADALGLAPAATGEQS